MHKYEYEYDEFDKPTMSMLIYHLDDFNPNFFYFIKLWMWQ